jgi:hypothetical protein
MSTTSSAASKSDLLDYMSDLLLELRAIAEQNHWTTLGGLLALAQAEATLRREEIHLKGRRSAERA